jgi:hypothetical protein
LLSTALSKPLDLACLFAMLALSILRSRIGIYQRNNDFQVPLIEAIRDPSAFPGDAFVRTLPHYASPFWWAVARVPASLSIPHLLMVGCVLARLFILYAAGRLAGAVAPTARFAKPLAWAYFALAPVPLLAGGTLVPDYFEHTSVSLGFIMLAFALLLERRPAMAGVALGGVFLCNFVYATYASTFLVPLLLMRKDLPGRWRVAAAIPIALPVLLVGAHASANHAHDPDVWIHALLVWWPIHFDPRSWPPGEVARFVAVAGAGGAAIWLTRDRAALLAAAWIAITLVYFAVALASVTVLHVPGLVAIQPARAVDAFNCVLATFALAHLAEHAEHAEGARLWMGGALVGVLFGAGWPLGAQGIAQAIAWAVFLPISTRARWGSLAAPATAAVAGAFALFSFAKRVHDGSALWTIEPPSDEMLVANEAAHATPPSAVFLVPPYWGSFRAVSERPVFVTVNEGAAILWQQDFIDGWLERLGALGYDLRKTARFEDLQPGVDRAYAALEDAAVCGLDRAYRVDYWVAKKGVSTHFPIAWVSADREVLAVRGHCGS